MDIRSKINPSLTLEYMQTEMPRKITAGRCRDIGRNLLILRMKPDNRTGYYCFILNRVLIR